MARSAFTRCTVCCRPTVLLVFLPGVFLEALDQVGSEFPKESGQFRVWVGKLLCPEILPRASCQRIVKTSECFPRTRFLDDLYGFLMTFMARSRLRTGRDFRSSLSKSMGASNVSSWSFSHSSTP